MVIKSQNALGGKGKKERKKKEQVWQMYPLHSTKQVHVHWLSVTLLDLDMCILLQLLNHLFKI